MIIANSCTALFGWCCPFVTLQLLVHSKHLIIYIYIYLLFNEWVLAIMSYDFIDQFVSVHLWWCFIFVSYVSPGIFHALLCWFFKAAVTSYLKLDDLKRQKFLVGLKARSPSQSVSRVMLPLKIIGENLSLLLPRFLRWASLLSFLWLAAPSHQSLPLLLHGLFPECLSSHQFSSSYKGSRHTRLAPALMTSS